jgi:hypothetical protein
MDVCETLFSSRYLGTICGARALYLEMPQILPTLNPKCFETLNPETQSHKSPKLAYTSGPMQCCQRCFSVLPARTHTYVRLGSQYDLNLKHEFILLLVYINALSFRVYLVPREVRILRRPNPLLSTRLPLLLLCASSH